MAAWTNLKHMLAAVFTKPVGFAAAWRDHADGKEPSSIEGRWEGDWKSTANGHQGKLRCIISGGEGGEYVAFFQATYARILRVSYKVKLEGHSCEKEIKLEGESNLGWLAGGTYRYSGLASADKFRCQYVCKYDEGCFTMHRQLRQ